MFSEAPLVAEVDIIIMCIK